MTPVTAMVLAIASELSLRGNDIKMLLCVGCVASSLKTNASNVTHDRIRGVR